MYCIYKQCIIANIVFAVNICLTSFLNIRIRGIYMNICAQGIPSIAFPGAGWFGSSSRRR